MTFMAQPPSSGYQTWTCACGRLGLAAALAACPDCELPRPEAGAPAAVFAAPVPPRPAGESRAPAARRRTRARREV